MEEFIELKCYCNEPNYPTKLFYASSMVKQYVDCTKMEMYFISVPWQPLFPFKMSENDCGARGGSMVS